MTKPQFAGDPSMDDILASIRKMIAEEPTGPRPVPDQIARTVFSGSVPQEQEPGEQPDQQVAEPIVSPQRATPNYSRLSDALATAAPANKPQQGSLEDKMMQLLGDRPAPTHDPAPISNPLAAFNGGQDSKPAARAPEQVNAFDKSASQSKEAPLPFGRRVAEAHPLSTDKTDSTESILGRAGSPVGAAEPFRSGAVGPKREETPVAVHKDASEIKPAAPVLGNPALRSALSVEPPQPSNPAITPKKASLVASLEKASAEAASEVHGKKADEPPISGAAASAPEAVAAALLEKSGARMPKADARSPGVHAANISPLGSRPKVVDAPSAQPEAPGTDTAAMGALKEASKQSGTHPRDAATHALDPRVPGAAGSASPRNAETEAALREAAKPGSAAPPSEALLDAVVDMVKNEPSSLSVFTSGSAFIHGVTGGEKPEISAAPPPKLDTAAAALLRPMLRQWLAENMPRIVEEALRSELDSSQKTGEGTDKA